MEQENLKKQPLLQAQDPFSGNIVWVRVVGIDKKRRVVYVVDGSATKRTIPMDYLIFRGGLAA